MTCFYYIITENSSDDMKREREEKKRYLLRKLSFRPSVDELKNRKVSFFFYITRDHKVVYIPWDFSFMNPFYIKGVYACGHKIFPLVLEVIKICPSFASLTHDIVL